MRTITKQFLVVNAVILALASLYYVTQANYEFLVYILSLVPLLGIVVWSDKRYQYPVLALSFFTIWMLSHMLGGSVSIGETRLYDLILWPIVGEPFHILKYDQVVHFFCYFTATLFTFAIVQQMASSKASLAGQLAIAFLAAIGIGSLNEVIEFLVFVFAENNGVGGIYNTGIDLIANMIGSLTAVFVLKYTHQK